MCTQYILYYPLSLDSKRSMTHNPPDLLYTTAWLGWVDVNGFRFMLKLKLNNRLSDIILCNIFIVEPIRYVYVSEEFSHFSFPFYLFVGKVSCWIAILMWIIMSICIQHRNRLNFLYYLNCLFLSEEYITISAKTNALDIFFSLLLLFFRKLCAIA